MPIKKKPLYLPLRGYKNESGIKEKFTLSSVIPFTFEKTENIVIQNKKEDLESIYLELKALANNKDDN